MATSKVQDRMRVFQIILPMVIFLLTIGSARCADFDLKKGSLTRAGPYATQFVSITNNTGALVPAARVECGFFREDVFLVMGMGVAEKVEPRQTVFVEVIANNAAQATKTDCRVVTSD